MAIKIKFEDEDGKVYTTQVIEDTDDVYLEFPNSQIT